MENVIQPLQQYTDIEILQRVLSGEMPLYEILIRRYNASLYKVGRAYGYNHQDTEDLMQETYISAWHHLATFENRAAFKTWLTRIMLNHCYRKKQKHSTLKEKPTDPLTTEKDKPMFHTAADTEKTLTNKELGYVVEKALTLLPEEYRLVFTLRELNGLSVSETAEALNISEGNVKVRMTRARNMLRNEIETMYSAQDIYEFNLVYCDKIVSRVMGKISAASY
jgi:RNA polymerase sigma factor (sigma-70 family)